LTAKKATTKKKTSQNPTSYHGFTKLEGERRVIALCKNYAILRTSVIYGWHPWKQNFVTWIVSQLRQNEEISVVEDHYNTPTLADNLAEMALEALQRGLKGLYHASGSERMSRYEFAKQIAESFQLDSSLIKPVKMSQLAAWIARRPRDSPLSTDKIRKQLRTRPLNITEGLSRMETEDKT
jgi:dTDP-4-dehydrorhamnose reductase